MDAFMIEAYKDKSLYENTLINLFDKAIDIMMIIYILTNFVTDYSSYQKSTKTILRCMKDYVFGKFILDLFSTIPCIFNWHSNIFMGKLYHFLRLIHLPEIVDIIKQIEP